MNERIHDRNLPTTAVMVIVTAALHPGYASHADSISSHADWPTKQPSFNSSSFCEPTVSFIEQSTIVEEVSAAEDFGREIGAVYVSLLEGQEPLDADCAAVWDENIDQLYES